MITIARGNLTESALLHEFIARGARVLVPFGEGHPYDLVVELPSGELLRVQCKTGWIAKGCMAFNGRMTDHGRGERGYHGLADLFGVYLPERSQTYLVPISDVLPLRVSLRLEPTRNNQRVGIRFAADYEIGRWTDQDLAALAKAPLGTERAA